MSVHIITDSTAGISQKEAAHLGICVVPLKTIFGETEYLDDIDLSPDEFYAKLAAAEELPTTSQPSPSAFEKVYRPALEAGDELIVITISEKLSGTLQSATIARDTCGGPIWLVDSETGCLAHEILVRRAIELRDEGLSATEIFEILEREKKDIRLFAAFDTLENLFRSGRLSRTSAFAGSLMKIKPVISVQDGVITPIAKCRGSLKAYEELFSRVEEEGGIDFSRPFALGYTGARDDFEVFKAAAYARYPDKEPVISIIGSAIGTHAGPGAVAISFFKHSH